MPPEPRQREADRFPQEGAAGGARRAASLPGAVEGRRGGGGGCCFSSCFSCASSSAVAMARPSFSLAACEVIGFDLDHTLCRYHLVESARLIYDSFAQYMVKEKGYDKELLNVSHESWDFCFKGLVLDMEDGNFLKLAEDGTVLRASHGTKCMTSEEILDTYGRKEWKHFKTMSGMVSRSENGGTYFPEVKRNPGKYIQCCPDPVKKWLRRLKDSGKILLLITSSHSDYCRLLCEHALGNDFEDLFDIVITNALKPGFFSQPPDQRPFRTLENDEEQEALLSLEKPGWYSQGNATHLYELLKKMTGKLEPKVVYFGDSMHSDIFSAHHYSNWETVLILEELQGDPAMAPTETESEPLEKKGKYEGHHPKALPSVSKQWGSFFVDTISGKEDTEETLVTTWSCKCVSAYSTITIPSIEAIADLPLDYRFTRFSSNTSITAGYYPKPPRSLLSSGELMATK
ncbi:5'-nucleotidase domain-containing protein 1 isoform X2 [Podarcis raffonei]|uniref:5'-nucleotidase domain-containing protein 1 isoform X2 n=1 Tax=Podarcis raffonei TaxID=65483 RepID=UPI00232977BB|nr:5'-nucleotidase domain-containing protein 1 isoform X2 [Podarcis raffonei]